MIGIPLSILLGGLLGYLVWTTYFRLPLPNWIIRFVINKESAELFTSLLGSREAAAYALKLIMIFVWSIPGALVFGLAGGLLAARLHQERVLAYSSLIWPLGMSLFSYVLLHSIVRIGHPGMSAFAALFSEHQETILVIYSAFLIVLFISMRVFGRGFKRNSLPDQNGSTTAPSRSASHHTRTTLFINR